MLLIGLGLVERGVNSQVWLCRYSGDTGESHFCTGCEEMFLVATCGQAEGALTVCVCTFRVGLTKA